MLSLNSIVSVIVNADSSSSSAGSFSAGLILAPAAEVSSSGDSSASEDASGSSGSSTAEGAAEGSDASSSVSSDRLRVFYTLSGLTEAGFSTTDPAYLSAKACFAASPAPDRVFVSLYPSAESLPDALDAALAAPLNDALTEDAGFYAIFVCETDTDRLLALAKDLDARPAHFMLFCGMTGDPAAAAASGSLFQALYQAASARAIGLFGADMYAPAALMGTAMGLARAYADSAYALCYKSLPGTVPTDLSENDVAALKALNANVYITRGHRRNLLENGTVFSGLRFDEIQTLDRISAALRDAAVDLLTGQTGKLPQADETSALFINRFTAVLSEFTARGLLATAPWRGSAVGALEPGDMVENGFRLWADSYDTQSDADRQAHKAMPISVALCLTGSVESLVIQVDVTG